MTDERISNTPPVYRFCVAPMLDWTDRHFRYFMRGLTKEALLYTEMITTGALLHGKAEQYLAYDEQEHPLVLQLGGSQPAELALCAKKAQALGYDEINLNVGCPSDRVQNNAIGACLMFEPERVAECLTAMQAAVSIPVTIKHRIGVDGHDSMDQLIDFVGKSVEAGCKRFIVHARIAILKGLSPKQNREIPPLRYDMAAKLKTVFPEIMFVVNGGVGNMDEALHQLHTFDGVMVGRAAYHDSYAWATVDQRIYGGSRPVVTRYEAFERMIDYINQYVASGGLAQHVTRHLLGLAQGFQGARHFRQLLSVDIHHREVATVLQEALALLENR